MPSSKWRRPLAHAGIVTTMTATANERTVDHSRVGEKVVPGLFLLESVGTMNWLPNKTQNRTFEQWKDSPHLPAFYRSRFGTSRAAPTPTCILGDPQDLPCR